MKRILLSLALALGIFAIPLPSFATVSSTTNTVQYSGDGHSTSFSFNNNVYLASDLNVYEVTAGVSTLLTLNTNYSVSLTAISGVTGAYTATINLAGGSIPAGALAVGTTLVIVRNIPYTQLINISDYSATPAATWNQAHDRGVILSQQLLNLVNRSILQAINATSPIVFPSAPGISNQLLGWDATGSYLINTTGVPGPTGPQGPAGSISSVTSANTDIGVANTTTTPVLTLNSGTSSNQIVKLNGSAQLPAVSGALLTSIPLVNQTALPYVKVSNTQTSGNPGGTATATAWTTMPLNTKDVDTSSIATLTNNQVSLPSGTYRVSAYCPFYSNLSTIQMRLYNVTGSAILVQGGSVSGQNSSSMYPDYLSGIFTISSTSAVALQYYVGVTRSTSDLGSPQSIGTEVYAIVEFTKIS
jgi:hypothetical protein